MSDINTHKSTRTSTRIPFYKYTDMKRKNNKLPKKLQSILWSVKIEDLDLQEDKVYIIHQILSFGNFKQLKWLLNNYSLSEIRKVFLENPIRIYRLPSFNFIKDILLKIKDKKINEKKYVCTPL